MSNFTISKYLLKKITIIIFCAIPIVGILFGLSLALIIPIFFISALLLNDELCRTEVNISNYRIFARLTQSKLEICFFAWCVLSCCWSISINASIFSVIKTSILALLGYAAIIHSSYISRKLHYIHLTRTTLIILLISLSLFYIEFLTDGKITILFRRLFQSSISHNFHLYYLDRGCSLLSLFAWVVIALLVKNNKNIFAIIIYILMAITLYISDSLSSFIGFMIGGIVYYTTKYIITNPKLLSALLMIGSISFIMMISTINPKSLSDNFNQLPISAKHRLFIWSFVSEKTSLKPFAGWGYGSTKYFDIQEDDMIHYHDNILHPLPSHPHNNILQILCETGIIGFTLYIMLICKYLIQWGTISRDPISDTRINAIIPFGYAFFANFFIIAMISFNIWQSWWLCSYIWIAYLFSWVKTDNL